MNQPTLFQTASLNPTDRAAIATKASTQYLTVLEFLRHNRNRNFTRREIAQATGYEQTSLCARLDALMKDGLVLEDFKRKCSVYPHVAVTTYRIK